MEHLFALKTYFKTSLAIFLLLMLANAPQASAASAPAHEKEKIAALIKQVSDLKKAKFVRNGSTYSADSAATFLRRKWRAHDSKVKTARDFIDKVASQSGTSGKPYLIRYEDGKEIHSRDFLLAELQRLEGPL